MNYATLKLIAALGDIKVILPVFFGACVALWWRGRRSEVIAWAMAMVIGIALIGFLKWLLPPLAVPLPWRYIHSVSMPSGHAGLSVLLYGYMTLALWGSRHWYVRALCVLPALATLAVCSIIYWLDWHSMLDIVTGIAVGGTLVLWARWLTQRRGLLSI